MPAVHKLHVVTYVWKKGDEDPDVAAHQILENAADPKAGVEGDASKAVLSHTDNFQCHGEDGTDGCDKLHNHAEERVIARMVGEDRVAVVWRKYHPLAAKGAVKPGKPFEAEHDGMKVRVEARLITDDEKDVLTDGAISMVALRNLDAELDKKHARHEQRDQLRNAVQAFIDGALQQTRAQLAQIEDRAKDLPGAKKTFPAVDKALDAIEADVNKELAALLKKDDAGAADLQALNARIQQETAKLAPALQPAHQLEQNAAALVALQGQIRAQLDRAHALDERVTAAKKDYAGLDDKALPHADVEQRIDALLEETRSKADLAVNDANARLVALTNEVGAREAALVGAVDAEQVKKGAFDVRVDRLAALKNGTLKKELVDYVEACGAAAGFNVKHWTATMTAAVDKVAAQAPDVGALSYAKAADEKTLSAAEKKVEPLTQALAALEADVKKRVDPITVHQVRGQNITPPSTWITATKVHPNGNIDAVVNVRNNGKHALVVEIKGDDPGVIHKTLTFAKKGERATFTLENVPKRFSVNVHAVGPEAKRGGPAANLTHVFLPTGSSVGVEGKGSTRHLPPLYFTPLPQQPNDVVAAQFGDEAGVQLSMQRVPGEG